MKTKPMIDRFWAKVKKTDTCWLWAASTCGIGYGQIGNGPAGSGCSMAHRYSYEIHKGPIPKGLCVCHKCDNTRCVNPDHLFLGTNHDNIKDMIKKGRHIKGAKIGGTKRSGELSHNSKLTEKDIIEIRKYYAKNYITLKYLAKKYGVNFVHIGNIVRNKSWQHIKTPPS